MISKRVLITCSRTPAALELVRAFGRAGCTVFTADTLRHTLASYSRYVKRHFVVPRADRDPEVLRRRVTRLSEELQLDLVVPTGEETFHLAGCAAPVFTMPLPLLKTLHSKIRFLDIAGSVGFSVPNTRWIQSTEDCPGYIENWVFKREFCRFGSDTFVGKLPTKSGPWLLQERLRGKEFSCYSVAVNGEMTAFSLYHPLHRLPGSSGLILQREHHDTAEESVSRFLKKLDFTGQLSFDFIETSDGLYAVDCNPRATSGIHFFQGTPELADCFFKTRATLLGSEGLQAFGPALPMLCGSLQGLSEAQLLLKDWWRAKEAGWSSKDPLPYLGLAVQSAETLVRSWKEGVDFQTASTRDMEWDGQGDHFTLLSRI